VQTVAYAQEPPGQKIAPEAAVNNPYEQASPSPINSGAPVDHSPRSPTQPQDLWARSGRPMLASRSSTSAISMSKKALSASKDYIKAHPGRTTAIAGGIVGGIGVVAQACGASGLSDTVAASKVFLNVQRARQRKSRPHSVSQPLATSVSSGAIHSAIPAPVSSGPSAHEVAQELFRMMKQQGHLASTIPDSSANNQPPNQSVNQGSLFNPQDNFQQTSNTIPQFAQQQTFSLQNIPQADANQTGLQFENPPNSYQDINQLSFMQQLFSSQQNPAPPITENLILSSPTADADNQAPLLAQAAQLCPSPVISAFSEQSPQLEQLSDPSILPLEQSTFAYDQLLQDLTSTMAADQAILSSETFTSSITGQDAFAQDESCMSSLVQQQDLLDAITSSVVSSSIIGGDYDDYDSC
jgi:hypothetical protein